MVGKTGLIAINPRDGKRLGASERVWYVLKLNETATLTGSPPSAGWKVPGRHKAG
jgi:hypothetical protein